MTHFLLGLYLLVVIRVTRLVNHDAILDPVRLFVARRKWATAGYFLSCPWCVSMWAGVGLAFWPVSVFHWSWWYALPLGLAASQITGWLARFSDDEEIEIESVAP